MQNLAGKLKQQAAAPPASLPITGYDTACQHFPRPSKSAVKPTTIRIGSQWHFDEFVNETIAKLSTDTTQTFIDVTRVVYSTARGATTVLFNKRFEQLSRSVFIELLKIDWKELFAVLKVLFYWMFVELMKVFFELNRIKTRKNVRRNFEIRTRDLTDINRGLYTHSYDIFLNISIILLLYSMQLYSLFRKYYLVVISI